MKKIIVSLIAIIMAITTTDAMAQELAATPDADNQVTMGFEGNKLVFKFAGNSTTGYAWKYSIVDESVVKHVSDQYNAPESGMAGAGGVHVFEFEGVASGSTRITFKYCRPWQGGETASEKTAKVKVGSDGKIVKVKMSKK